ncbi:DUF4124 domain-containing protein [Rhodanobacter sp. DHB23]|nr:DUF4124 domain-containing protein [Rhodanobacter sp. DHB23]
MLLAATAHGQSIFKCKQKDGTTAYQDHPCPDAPNARPAMVIKPGDEAGDDSSQSRQLTPQQQAQLAQARIRLRQSLERLQADLQRIQAKQAQAAGSAQQGETANTH